MAMKSKQQPDDEQELTQTWPLPYAATFGSSVRVKGLFLEVRASLPVAAKKALKIVARELVLQMPFEAGLEFRAASGIVSDALEGIASLPVIPREIEDILSISATERYRWLKDGRLPSVGTRTVKLRGRSRQVTFHVFDPRFVEDVLDRDLVEHWREEDAATAAENRRRAAWKAKLTRSQKVGGAADSAADSTSNENSRPRLIGWAAFVRDGPLR